MPRSVRYTILEWRARSIRDPLQRLQYLRNSGPGSWHDTPSRVHQWLARNHLLALIGISILAMAVGSAYTLLRTRQIPQLRAVLTAPPLEIVKEVETAGEVWLVEQRNGEEIFSNGLRVDDRYVVSNVARNCYRAFEREHPDVRHAHWKDKPAGIVYHTTESNLARFEELKNRELRRNSLGALHFAQQNHAYHFLIDRFGGVFRIVPESDIAFHSGNSIWADAAYVYVNLNVSFLGIAFEAQTRRGKDEAAVSEAQIGAARALTAMLRSKYQIPATSCVTHAQVSINPWNLLIGYHTDWADQFPFRAVGLPDNYRQAPASMVLFGFDYDPAFVRSTGALLLPGLVAADGQVAARAAGLNLSAVRYRADLQGHFKEIMAAVRGGRAARERTNEQQ